jgi:hypothetical protein
MHGPCPVFHSVSSAAAAFLDSQDQRCSSFLQFATPELLVDIHWQAKAILCSVATWALTQQHQLPCMIN